MPDQRMSMDRKAVESMQENLSHSEPTIVAAYGLIGAIIVFGAAGFVVDHYLHTQPWALLLGLVIGIVIGFGQLVRVVKR